ncbi:DNA-directed RNA polymerase subunit beta [Nocardia callitridis]|uniref:DNA-directed RNA polymerase subunit beta n=1 Tax=Nocardia callitridis TaxID=648753 RepID=A0ABP9K2U0_9NOCA
MDHIPFGDTPLSRCHFYRRVCDLPAVIDPPHLGRIIMPATHVWALMLPGLLGQAIKVEMQSTETELGPIIAHPRSRRWTYLVRPDLPEEDSLFREMFRLNVSIIRSGATIALPSPTDQCVEFRRWVQPPRSFYRPSGLAVLDAIRRCRGVHYRRAALD